MTKNLNFNSKCNQTLWQLQKIKRCEVSIKSIQDSIRQIISSCRLPCIVRFFGGFLPKNQYHHVSKKELLSEIKFLRNLIRMYKHIIQYYKKSIDDE